jgi:hypothetical protein
MSLLEILKIASAIATILTGVVNGGRGVTEIRAILGGFFIGLGAAMLILNDPVAYLMMGIAYLVVAGVRTISMFIDKSVVQSNVVSVITELILGIILVL